MVWEHMFVTSRGFPHGESQRALGRGNVWVAEAVARELHHVSLEDAFRLVHLSWEKEWPKAEPATMRWLERYLTERKTTLKNFAKVVRELDASARWMTGGRLLGVPLMVSQQPQPSAARALSAPVGIGSGKIAAEGMG